MCTCITSWEDRERSCSICGIEDAELTLLPVCDSGMKLSELSAMLEVAEVVVSVLILFGGEFSEFTVADAVTDAKALPLFLFCVKK